MIRIYRQTEEGRQRQSEAGKTKDKRKGYGSMSKEERSIASRRAALIRWGKLDEYQLKQNSSNDTAD